MPIGEVIFPDKNDHFLYELAITAEAVAIVTGDKELLRIKRVKAVEILSPEKFCRKFKIK
jgi:predicted nucleic acid-binding protein